MKRARFPAVFLLAAGSCGPVETFPPHVDAGPPVTDAGEACDGVCVPRPPTYWIGPLLAWMGDEAAAPLCPAPMLFESYTAHGYLDGPIHCDACTCGPTSGTCEPSAKVTAAAASCAKDGPDVEHTSSDPPATWTGLCNGENAIPLGKLCGGVPCVQSVTIGPVTANETGCLPIANTNASPPPWNRFVRACTPTSSHPSCAAFDEVCVVAAPESEFKQCIFSFGKPAELKCPPSYPDQNVFYDSDTPRCAPCACEAPTGNGCTGDLKLFQDGSCNTPLGASIPLDGKGPVCVDVPAGSAVGSKKATVSGYQPGSCKPSGGVPEGAIICCQP
jgi:hypothetical protein